jgi:NADPH:quinone reductase-like Zn-dependent oxidoreductase
VRAVQFAEYGGPEVLGVADVAEPHAGPGQIRIAVRAASVNAIDWKNRSGMLAEYMPVERIFSFEEAAEAQRVNAAGHVRGKLVLVPL